jgi:uncharacterized phage-like protein YoqJ
MLLDTTVAITGHRPDRLGGYEGTHPMALWVKSRIRDVLVQLKHEGYEDFVSGGALGTDQWSSWIALELGFNLTIARPFPSQDSVWPETSRKAYRELLNLSKVVDVSEDPYHPSKLFLRNQWMVDHSSCLIAVYDGGAGGTAHSYKYAKKKNKRIELINPLDYCENAN